MTKDFLLSFSKVVHPFLAPTVCPTGRHGKGV
jgi:hypothetical protein